MEVLGKVNTSATYALRSSETNKVDDLVMAAKVLTHCANNKKNTMQETN